ncbi:MAG: 3'-5' exonuclease [Caldisericia bacterium]
MNDILKIIREIVAEQCTCYKDGTCLAVAKCEFSDGGRMDCCHFLNHQLPRILREKKGNGTFGAIRELINKHCSCYKNGACSAALMCEFDVGGRMDCCHFLNYHLPLILKEASGHANTLADYQLPDTNGKDICVIDAETTGLSPLSDRMIEVYLIKYSPHRFDKGSLEIFLKSDIPLSPDAAKITGITQEQIDESGSSPEASLKALAGFIGHDDTVLVFHNHFFDFSFLSESFKRAGMPELRNPVIDTFEMAARLYPHANCHLVPLAIHLGIDIEKFGKEVTPIGSNGSTSRAHRAGYDARLTAEIFFILEQEYLKRGKK